MFVHNVLYVFVMTVCGDNRKYVKQNDKATCKLAQRKF
jgi:hypothetical protein